MTDSLTETYRSKLKDLLNNYQIYYDRKVSDYVFVPIDQLEEKHIKWYEAYLSRQKNNDRFKSLQRKVPTTRTSKKLKEPLVCEHCGYKYWSVYTGAFQQHHGDNCKFKKTKHEG